MIGIICFWDRTATPYLQKYEEMLQATGKEYEIIFWNRTGIPRATGTNEIDIDLRCRNNPLLKLFSFFCWRSCVVKILRNKNYEKLIVLSTMPAVLLRGYLMRKYRNAYLFDIRDYTWENNLLFGGIVNELVEHSALTAISSKGFLRWLSESPKIVVNHNITWRDCTTTERIYFTHDRLNFTFVGNVRLDNQTRMVLNALKNHPRFRSCFVGRIMPMCDILSYCKENAIENCAFEGEFHYTQKAAIYQNVDFINAVYANAPSGKLAPGDSTPIPNRLYDGLVFKVPIVCCKGTYLAEIVEQYHLGFALDAYTDNVVKCFEEYIANFDKTEFLKGCEEFLSLCIQEENVFEKQVLKFLSGEGK